MTATPRPLMWFVGTLGFARLPADFAESRTPPAPPAPTLADVWALCRQWDDRVNVGAGPMREDDR